MSGTRLLTLLLVPVLVGCERFAYYGVRSLLVLDLTRRFGLSMGEAGALLTLLGVLVLVVPLLGGVLALALGPRIVAIAGAVVAAVGYALLGTDASRALALVIVGLGVGIFKPCIWAMLADAITDEEAPAGAGEAPRSPRRFALMGAAALASYATINVGAMLAPVAASFVAEAKGFGTTFFGLAGTMLVTIVLAAAIAVLPRMGRSRGSASQASAYRAPASLAIAVPPPTPLGAPMVGLLALLGASIPFELGSPVAYSVGYLLHLPPQVEAVSSFFLVVASAASFVLLLVVALSRRSFPLTWAFGGALLVFGVGLVPLLLAGSAAPFVLGAALTAAAEPLVTAVGLAYAALATGRRSRTLVVGAWLLLTSLLQRLPPSEGAWRVELAIFAVLAIASGAVLLVVGRRLHRFAFENA
jgi:dipeptide/tripeptide permease